MPLGKVFDASENQVLFSPIRSYYQGKALRADTALREKQGEALQMEIDSAPAAAAAAAAKEQREIDAAKRAADKAIADGQDRQAGILAEGFAAAVLTKKDSDDNVLATKAFDDVLAAYDVDPAKMKEFKGQYDPDGDGTFNDELFAPMQAFAERIGSSGAIGKEKSYQQADFIDPSGRATQGAFDPDTGTYAGSANSPIAPQAGQGDISGVNASGVSRNTIDFQENVIGAVGAVQMGTELMTASAANPEALGVPGGMMRFGSNLVSGATAIADWAGYERVSPEDKEKQTMGSSAFDYDSIDTKKLGVSGAEAEKFRAGVYGIAFAAAVAEQGTRPTDKDIQQFIDQIGGRATSAQSFRETIFQFMRRQDRRLKTIADVKRISPVDREAAFSSWTPSFNKFVESYAGASGRKTATNAETGQRFIEMTPGNWEEF